MSDFNFADWARLDSQRPSTWESFTSGAKAAQELNDHNNADAAMKALQADPNNRSALTALARYNPNAAASVRADNALALEQSKRQAQQALAQSLFNSTRSGEVSQPQIQNPTPVVEQAVATP